MGPRSCPLFFLQIAFPALRQAAVGRRPGKQGRDLLVRVASPPAAYTGYVESRLPVDCGKPEEGLNIARDNQDRQGSALLVADRNGIASALQADRPAVDRAVFAQGDQRIAIAVAATQVGAEHEYLAGLIGGVWVTLCIHASLFQMISRDFLGGRSSKADRVRKGLAEISPELRVNRRRKTGDDHAKSPDLIQFSPGSCGLHVPQGFRH